MPSHGRERRATFYLSHELIGALERRLLTAGAPSVDEHLADLVLRLASFGLKVLLKCLDLIIADDDARTIASANPAAPADFGAELVAKGVGADTLGRELSQELIGAGVVVPGDIRQFAVNLIIGSDEVEFLCLALAYQLLHFQPLVDQGANGFPLNLRHILLVGLNT